MRDCRSSRGCRTRSGSGLAGYSSRTPQALRAEYVTSGRARLYEALTEFRLDAPEQRAYAEAATQLGLSESAVKSAIHRLRQRHHQLVREEISQTLENPAEADEEIRYLLGVVAG